MPALDVIGKTDIDLCVLSEMFVCLHSTCPSAKAIHKDDLKKKFTEISTHSLSAVVSTHSSFDIRFMDDSGSPKEDEFLQVGAPLHTFCTRKPYFGAVFETLFVCLFVCFNVTLRRRSM